MRDAKKIAVEDLTIRLRGTSAQERVLHRLHTVTLVLKGYSASEAGRIFGDSPRAVAYWVKRFKKAGVHGLADVPRPGRPGRLGPSHMKRLQTYMQDCANGNARMLRAYIIKRFRITLTLRHCQRIFTRLSA
jgi:transposase